MRLSKFPLSPDVRNAFPEGAEHFDGDGVMVRESLALPSSSPPTLASTTVKQSYAINGRDSPPA
jgi:hypothetical protein